MTRLQFIGFHPVEVEGLSLKAGDTVGSFGDVDSTHVVSEWNLAYLETRSDFVEFDETEPPEAPEPDPEE